jgi:hypothetical protein
MKRMIRQARECWEELSGMSLHYFHPILALALAALLVFVTVATVLLITWAMVM